MLSSDLLSVFFFIDPATTEIYTLSLHDALPIFIVLPPCPTGHGLKPCRTLGARIRAPGAPPEDRKSTRLNSSHVEISYAVFCLKKKTALSRWTVAIAVPRAYDAVAAWRPLLVSG